MSMEENTTKGWQGSSKTTHNAWIKHNPDPNHPDGCKNAKQQQQARAVGHPGTQRSNSMRAVTAVFDAAVTNDEEEE
eukprot:14364782-Ditylum_brightwellii.AAC.1